jgi:regulator of PEP synthase PpsR (kinase-PPPase family)
VTSVQDDSDKMVVPLMIDKQVHMTIKLYCVKTGITMKEFFQPYSEQLEKQLLVRASEITEMERHAETQRQKELEDQRLASEHPLEVPGIQIEDPISN